LRNEHTGIHVFSDRYTLSPATVTGNVARGNQMDLAMLVTVATLPQVKAGKVKALAITVPQRLASAPEIPTLAEGGVPGFSGAPGFIGMVAPLGTPPAVIRHLSSEIAAIVARPDVQAKIATLSVEPGYSDEKTFGAYLVAESVKIKEIIKTLPPPQ